MICPRCQRKISPTAIRCRYCKYVVKKEARKKRFFRFWPVFEKISKDSQLFWNSGKDAAHCPWTIGDVLAISVIIWVFVFHDPFGAGFGILKWARANFNILTREPKLYFYLAVYINTIILKIVSLFFLFSLIRSRNLSFRRTVLSRGEKFPYREFWLPLYILTCIVFKVINDTNPLVPSIPFNSIFPEARITGNIVIIFSVLFVAPFVEEIIFRGFLYPAFNKYLGVYPAIIATTFLFTMAHYPQVKENPVFILVLSSLSIIITFVKAKTGSTWAAIVMHHIYNLVVVLAGFIDFIALR